MSDRHEVVILVNAAGAARGFQQVSDGAKRATADLSKLGPTGKASLNQVAVSGRTASDALERTSRASVALGAALGTAVSGLAFVGQAAVREQQQIDGLTRAYGDAAGEIIAFADQIQGATIFSDEDAREALRIMATLQLQYGLTTEQIRALTNATADLATVTGIGLADAAMRTSSAIRGETESAEYLGLTLNQQSIDRENLTLTMTNQEAAQFRLTALLEQATFAEGAAGDRAETTAGQVAQLGNAAQDAATGVGNLLGPTAAAAAPLAQVALALPVVFGGLGRVATAAPSAARALTSGAAAATAFVATLNPLAIGLTAVATAGVAGMAMWKASEQAAADYQSGLDSLNRTISESLGFMDQIAARPIRFDMGIEEQQRALDALGFTETPWEDFAAFVGLVDSKFDDLLLTQREQLALNAQIEESWRNVARGGVDQLTGAMAELVRQTEAFEIDPSQTAAVLMDLNDILRYNGEGAEIVDAKVAKLNENFARNGDLQQYAYGLSVINDNLAETIAYSGEAATAVAAFTDEQRKTITQLPALIASAADASAQVVRDQQGALVDAAEAATEASAASAERAGAQQTRAAERSGRDTARAASTAGREQTRSAEQAETAQVRAAERAAAGQIAAAEAAEEAQVESAQAAADAQVAQAERAERTQVRAAESAARAQTRGAEEAAREQVRAATLAANEQVRQADRMEASVAAAAEARAKAIVESARAAHESRVEAADDAAEAEIAAAKRATEATLLELERRAQATARRATDQASQAIAEANDAAFRRIRAAEGTPRHGRVVAEEAKRLAKIQTEAYAEQERAQANALRRQEEGAARAEAEEARRIDAAEEARAAAAEASAQRLAAIEERAQAEAAARTEAAAREAERIRTDAARNVAQVERETARATANVARDAAQDAARIARAAARETAAVQEQAAASVAATQEAAAANTARVTAQANREAARENADAARATERVRTGAARSVALAERATAREVRGIARETAQAQSQAARDAEEVRVAAARAVESAERDAERAAEEATAAVLIGAAEADPALAEMLAAQGMLRQGAQGEFEVIIDDPSAQALARIESLFGPDAAALNAQGQIQIVADFAPLNAAVAEANGKTVGSVRMAIHPLRSGRTGFADGGVIPAGGGVFDVGERGRETVFLPGGTYVRPAPATEAAAGAGPVALHFHGPVYGFDDFEARVGAAAASALGRALPQAIADRRRALGA